MKRILWLTSWYPNKLEPLSGDFIERHAKAASLKNKITVVHVVKDYRGVTPGRTSIARIEYPGFPNLIAYIGYYKARNVFGAFGSFVTYLSIQRRLIRNYVRENGKPDLINVHISYKAGLGALYCKWFYDVPYIVSEQWTIFCPEARPSFNDQPQAARWLLNKIYRNASGCTAVSDYLSAALMKRFNIVKPSRIPNVVDRQLFFPGNEKHEVFTFIHVSTLNYQKAPEHIIKAIEILKSKASRRFMLIIYGPKSKALTELIKSSGLNEYVDYRNEVSQDILAAEMRKCHSLVLYSRFETFGCVIIEAMAAGLPVVVSDIPVMREIVTESVTGLFATPGSPEALSETMLQMMERYSEFNAREIAQNTIKAFSFEEVSGMFDESFKRFSSPTPARLHQG